MTRKNRARPTLIEEHVVRLAEADRCSSELHVNLRENKLQQFRFPCPVRSLHFDLSMRVCLLAAAISVACNGNISPEGAADAAPSTGAEIPGDGRNWFENPNFQQEAERPMRCLETLDAEKRPVLRRTEAQLRTILADVLGNNFSQVPLTEDGRVAGYRAHGSDVTELEASRYSEFSRAVSQAVRIECSEDCDSQVFALVSELFGRPLRDDEQQRFRDGFDNITRELGLSAPQAATLVLEAALQSPGFLYTLEPSAEESALARNTDIAGRLAQFLWLSVPDAELRQAAENGDLLSDAGYEAQVRRMLADPKAERMLIDFHSQWLWLDEVRGLSRPSEEAFPDVNEEVIAAMKNEFERFVIDASRSPSAGLDGLFAGTTSRPDPALETIYGGTLDGNVRQMEEARAGVLSLPYVLSTHAHPEESSTVWRGQLIRTQLLCSAIPAPPADAALLAPDATGLSKPEAFEALLAVDDGGCATCHRMMDPLGFALEHFDASGAYRSIDERGFDVDASGSAFNVPADDSLAQDFSGARELAEALASSKLAERCYVEHWLRYAWAASPRGNNACHAQTVYESFVQKGRSIEELVVAIAMSPAFRFHGPQEENLVCQ